VVGEIPQALVTFSEAAPEWAPCWPTASRTRLATGGHGYEPGARKRGRYRYVACSHDACRRFACLRQERAAAGTSRRKANARPCPST
jgi:hypothetical protein